MKLLRYVSLYKNKQLALFPQLYSQTKSVCRNYAIHSQPPASSPPPPPPPIPGKLTKGLVLGIYEKNLPTDEPILTSAAERFDHRCQGNLIKLIQENSLTGKIGKGKIFNNLDAEFNSVAVIGLGRPDVGYNELESIEEGMESVRLAAAVGALRLDKQGCQMIFVDSMDCAEAAAEGSALAIWKYQDNLMREKQKCIPKLELFDSPDMDMWTKGLIKAEAQNRCRRLCDTPANQMTPTIFARAAVDSLCPCGVNVEIRNVDWLETQRLTGILAVAKSSGESPLFLEINYCGSQADAKPILLIGEGLTFNSGGLCLKKPEDLAEYRGAMAGAAVVVSAIRAAATLALPINITGLIPLCENMPSSMAFKPGDVIQCANGKHIGVHNTGYAGTLLLADTLIYGQTTFKPKLIVDVATSTNSIRHAFGDAATGVFSNSNGLCHEMCKAGSITGDRVWKMPLWKYYLNNISNYDNIDLSNTGHGEADACLAAAFLKNFVMCPDWIHMDIRGVGMYARNASIPYLREHRMTGRPTRTLIQFLQQIACPDVAAVCPE